VIGHNIPPPAWGIYGFSADEAELAARQWAAITAALAAEGRLTAVTAHPAERLVIARVLYARAAALAASGELVEQSEKGGAYQAAAVTVMNAQSAAASRLEAELKLSPKARGAYGADAKEGPSAPASRATQSRGGLGIA